MNISWRFDWIFRRGNVVCKCDWRRPARLFSPNRLQLICIHGLICIVFGAARVAGHFFGRLARFFRRPTGYETLDWPLDRRCLELFSLFLHRRWVRLVSDLIGSRPYGLFNDDLICIRKYPSQRWPRRTTVT